MSSRRANARTSDSGGDRNYVSFWFWFFAMLVAAIPCIGWIMILIWAFWGDNQSRKNYYKAVIAWALIIFAIWVALAVLGFWPFIEQFIRTHWPPAK